MQRGKKVSVVVDAVGSHDKNAADVAFRQMQAKGARLIETRSLAGLSHLKRVGVCGCDRCQGLLEKSPDEQPVAKVTANLKLLNELKTNHNKPIIGILGGICSGKSTVAAEFARLGCAVIDADKMAKDLLDEPKFSRKYVKLFGKDLLNSDGKIDRGKLAEAAFSDPAKLEAFTKIIHPPVLEKTNNLIETYKKTISFAAIVLDIPLLAEVGWEKRLR